MVDDRFSANGSPLESRPHITNPKSHLAPELSLSLRVRRALWWVGTFAASAASAVFTVPLIQKIFEDRGTYGDARIREGWIGSAISTAANPAVAWPTGFLAGCAFAALTTVALIARDRLPFYREHRPLTSPDEAVQLLGAQCAMTPLLNDPWDHNWLEDGRSPYNESIQSLKLDLQFALQKHPSTLCVTSALPGEGKSLLSYTLARSYAELGRRVIIIDADMRRPSVHKMFSITNRLGLSIILSGLGEYHQCIHKTEIQRLFVMTSGPIPPNPAQLLQGPYFSQLLSKLKEEFDTIVIDCPPTLGLVDAPTIANFCELMLFVIRAGHTRLVTVRRSLARFRVPFLLVLNGVRLPSRDFLRHEY